MWHLLLLFVACCECASLGKYELLDYNPRPSVNASVVVGNARFTILTPRLIRMEQVSNGKFEDRATLAFVNRMLPVPEYTTSQQGGVLTIRTNAVTLTYTLGQAFSPQTLSVKGNDASSAFRSWQYGQSNPNNLLGTIKSLDMILEEDITLNCTKIEHREVHEESLHCTWGLVSRDGWVVVDDTPNWAVDETYWWAEPNRDQRDLYLFAHGHDYRGALADYVLVGGRPAMPPRYANGIWWTRWYDLDNNDVEKVVEDYSSRSFPLDLFVLDMDWHTKDGWGGYTFDARLFPSPSTTLGWLHRRGLHTMANLHDNDGVRTIESQFLPFCAALGINPHTVVDQVPLTCCSNRTISYALEDVVMRPVENMGMDHWWIDWQQGGTKGGCSGLAQNPTIALSRLRSTDHLRRGEAARAMVLARWGGLGSHRYPVGFSGDVLGLTWANLAYQPYYTLTSANVAYGFWSHDLMGPDDDLTLMTRWLQWGAFSPVFRSHDRGESAGICADLPVNLCAIVQPWNVPTHYFEINRAAMVGREELVPYIYTATRATYDSGLALLRPMYYDYPELSGAYSATPTTFGQYMFGDDMLVAPVVSRPDDSTGLTSHSVWLPPGTWVQRATGRVHAVAVGGGTVLTKNYPLEEIPVFVRAGAIIPTIPVRTGATLGLAAQQYAELALNLYLGGGSVAGSTVIYEDDGLTTAYVAGASARTTVGFSSAGGVYTVTASTQGSYPELPSTRSYTLRLINVLPPTRVVANGATINYSVWGEPNTWHYDGPEATLVVVLEAVPITSKLTVTVAVPPDSTNLLNGLRGYLRHAVLAKRNLDEDRKTPGVKEHDTTQGRLMEAASAGPMLSHLAGTNSTAFAALLRALPAMYAAAETEIDALSVPEAIKRVAYSRALLASAHS